MSAAEIDHDWTALRSLEMRTRSLALDAQMGACIDLLQSPEFVVVDLVRSVEQARQIDPRVGRVSIISDDEAEKDAFFYPARELFVQGDRCSFTCLATTVGFQVGGVDETHSDRIDYAAVNRFNAFDRDIYRGILGPAPAFDLCLVLWDEDEIVDPRRPLCELTRDLAEVLKRALYAEPRFPPVLNDIVCLRMNPKRFDGRLRFVWRV